MKLIDKDALVAEIDRRKEEEVNYDEDSKSFASYADNIYYSVLDSIKDFLDTLEVKDVNEVPATVMVNKYGNYFISSWPGLKEYDDLKEGQEIKIIVPKK